MEWLDVEQPSNSDISSKESTTEIISSEPTVPQTEEQALFENRMQWLTYTVAELLYYDISSVYRSDFITLLNTNDNIIRLDDLLGSNPVNDHFKADFTNLIGNYIIGINENGCRGRPEGMEDRPKTSDTEFTAEIFIDYLIIVNCIELYFPKSLIFSEIQESVIITSTAHPLNINQTNNGVQHYYFDEVCSGTTNVIVNLPYVNDNENIIVARPYKLDITTCAYNEYSFNFTDFLNLSF